MKKQPEMLPLGQRSIASTFLFRSPNQSTGCEKKVESKASNQKGSSISLSDFFSKKLQKSPVLPGVVPGNKKFSVPACSKYTTKCVNGRFNHSKDGETGLPCALDAIFEQYKNTMKESHGLSTPNDSAGASISVTENVRTSRKRGLIEAGGVIALIIMVICLLWVGVVDDVGFHPSGTAINIAKLPVTINLYSFCYGSHSVFPNI